METPSLSKKIDLMYGKKRLEGVVIEITPKSIVAISRHPFNDTLLLEQTYTLSQKEGAFPTTWFGYLFCGADLGPKSANYNQYDKILKEKGL